MNGVHIFSTPVLQRIDTGERREAYCWHCRKRTTRVLVAVYCDSPYFEPHGMWPCADCRRDTTFGVSPYDCRPVEWEPVGTAFRVPEWWMEAV